MTEPPPITRIPNIRHNTLPPRDERDWVLSMELLEETGITYSQLDYWCRTGLLTPREDIHGSGWTRSFDADQVHRATCIRELLDVGMALQVIRDVIDDFQHTGTVQLGGLIISRRESGDAA